MPTTPQSEAGWRTDPPVSEPAASGARPAATAAVDPPLEPPGTRERSHGLRVVWKPLFSVEEPIANSSRFVFPKRTAPAARTRAQAVASYGGRQFPRIFDEQVVRIPCVQKLSLSAIGIPARGGRGSPRARAASHASA